MKAPNLHNNAIEHPIVSSITNEAPVIRTICNYWRETIRQNREKRLYNFLEVVATKISEIEDALIDKKQLGSADYYNTVENLSEQAFRTNDKIKIDYLKNFLINYSLKQRPDITEKDIYLSLFNQLSGFHFLILNDIFNSQKKLTIHDLKVLKDSKSRDELIFIEDLKGKHNTNTELVLVTILSLKNLGLVFLSDSFAENPYVVIEPIGFKMMKFLNNFA
jgi:hypothetical protein